MITKIQHVIEIKYSPSSVKNNGKFYKRVMAMAIKFIQTKHVPFSIQQKKKFNVLGLG